MNEFLIEERIEDRNGAVAVLTLHRPERLNALDLAARHDVAQRLARLGADPRVRVAVLTGAGTRAFCAGQDLNESAALGGADGGDWIGSWERFFEAFYAFPRPLLAALNGVTAGAGLEIAMFADIRLAVPAARLIMAEVDVGLPALVGSSWLRAHVLDSRMLEIVLSGRTIGAAEAHDMGLVHEVVPAPRLRERAIEVAQGLAAKPARAMALNVRRLREMRRAQMGAEGLGQALRRYQVEAVASGEPQQVMATFLEERRRRRQANDGRTSR